MLFQVLRHIVSSEDVDKDSVMRRIT